MSRYPLLYLAYGANTNREAMSHRCPTATYAGNARLMDFRLVFRSVADVIPVKGREVVCAVWEIMAADEAALDRFEGFPSHYGKQYCDVIVRGVKRRAMFYVMAGHRVDRMEPPGGYEWTLRDGYRDCGMPEAQIDEAIADAQRSHKRETRYRGGWTGTKKGERPGQKKPRATSLWDQVSLDKMAREERAKRRDQPMSGHSFPDWMIDPATGQLFD